MGDEEIPITNPDEDEPFLEEVPEGDVLDDIDNESEISEDIGGYNELPISEEIQKDFFELNVMVLSRGNIAWVLLSIAIIYFFITQVLMYDLYDLPKSN